ncbi:unnamed protein product, partial [Iphiclides podalirius]
MTQVGLGSSRAPEKSKTLTTTVAAEMKKISESSTTTASLITEATFFRVQTDVPSGSTTVGSSSTAPAEDFHYHNGCSRALRCLGHSTSKEAFTLARPK